MASVSGVLPNIFRWIFTVLVGLMALAALAICVLMLINPHVPAGAHFGPTTVDFGQVGEPGTVYFHPANGDFDFQLTAFHGTISFFIGRAGGLIETLKHFGLPLWLLHVLFLGALFELLRRLFRNVGRGDSFSPGTVRLVQLIGGLLIVSSFILSFAQNLFGHAVINYLLQHAVITVSGTQVHLPAASVGVFPRHRLTLNGAMFFYGLLVLALSEVFRQGIALKKENELTI
ncbi:MAG TPA: DUF2975 domain-containing protein [Rhizomicrobium sp.]|nr:DUF2975 domain-containing protein [Rhizomicrobium sp.]